MARGSRPGSGGGGGFVRTSVTVQSGTTADLSDNPLRYGADSTPLSAGQRAAVEAQEKKRLSAKIEFVAVYDASGHQIGAECRGGRDSCNIPECMLNTDGSVLTHNHPCGKGKEGIIGGSFSEDDIDMFETSNVRTMRASAAEGTYSMTKGAGFDGKGLMSYIKSVDSDAANKHRQRCGALVDLNLSGNISLADYNAGCTKSFNAYLVDLHNAFIGGQKKYGYTYGLEART